MRRVRQQINVPVTAGQSELSATGCRRLIEEDAVDIINFDASWGGGPTAWRKVAAVAETNNTKIGHHEEPHLAMHLLASVPNALFLEGFHPDMDPIFHDMLIDPPEIADGRLTLPKEPGLGIHLNWEYINEHMVTY